MGNIKYNKKHLWHYYFFIDGVKYLHGRMFSEKQALTVKRINSH